MNRLDIIQTIIDKMDAKKYLEIGVQSGYVLDNLRCQDKVGVDPNPNTRATLFLTSDEFFAQNQEVFDVVFIDGLHHSDQVLRDIENALKFLNPNGYIVCHDMDPENEITQRVPQETDAWTGDCWKAWVTLRSKRSDLSMFVLDTDYGCGIIRFGSQECINIDCPLNWDNLVKNRQLWLNLIPISKLDEML